jgi:hypothetical protein
MIQQVTKVRDLAGKDIKIKKLDDANSKGAIEKAKAASAAQSASVGLECTMFGGFLCTPLL